MKLVLILWLAVVTMLGAAAERPAIALLPFNHPPDDKESATWSHMLMRDLEYSLLAAKVVRVQGSENGLRIQKIRPGSPISEAAAVLVGRELEVRRVLWGTLTRTADGWQVEAKLLNPASGDGEQLDARGATWWELRDSLVRGIFIAMKLAPADQDAADIHRHWTRSDEALALAAKMAELMDLNGSCAEAEDLSGRAVELDPESDLLWTIRGSALSAGGRIEESLDAFRKALALNPRAQYAHLGLINGLYLEDSLDDALREAKLCLERNPESSRALQLMSAFISEQDPEQSLKLLERARALDRHDPEVISLIAYTHACMGKREAAEQCLREAIALAEGEPVLLDVERRIGLAATKLGDLPRALTALRRALAQARAEQLGEKWIAGLQQQVAALERTQQTVPVEATRPRTFTPATLDAALRKKLTPAEFATVRNPFAANDEVRRWAHELAKDATTDETKARALFEALAARPRGTKSSTALTAAEVHAQWHDPHVHLVCRHLTILWVALARELGLDAFLANVDRDYDGDAGYHVCAALFLDGKCLLIDPTYHCFGVPHQEFQVLDDVQAAALYLLQLDDPDAAVRIAAGRAGCKLFPESGFALSLFANICTLTDRLDEAERALDEAERVDPRRWDLQFKRAVLATKRGHLDEGRRLAEAAAAAHPRSPYPNLVLAIVMYKQKQPAEARVELRTCLGRSLPLEDRDEALRLLAAINDELGDGDDSPAARGRQLEQDGELAGAAAAYEEALKEKPDSFTLHLKLGKVLVMNGAAQAGLVHLRKGIELEKDLTERSYVEMAAMVRDLVGGREAMELLDCGLARYPESVDLRFVRVTCLLRLDDSEGALAAGRDPMVLTSRLLLTQQANVLILFGEWDAAGKMMNLAQKLPAQAPEQIYQLSSPVLALLGRFAEALADHSRLKDTAYGREHQEETAAFQKALTTMADWDRQIRQRLAGGRAPDAEARSLLQQASEGLMTSWRVSDSQAREYFQQHRAELAARTGEREATTISIPLGDGADKIAETIRTRLLKGMPPEDSAAEFTRDQRARVGDREWIGPDDLVEPLQQPVFATKPGTPTGAIHTDNHLFLAMIHASRNEKEPDLSDPATRATVNHLVLEARRKDWERWYAAKIRRSKH